MLGEKQKGVSECGSGLEGFAVPPLGGAGPSSRTGTDAGHSACLMGIWLLLFLCFLHTNSQSEQQNHWFHLEGDAVRNR